MSISTHAITIRHTNVTVASERPTSFVYRTIEAYSVPTCGEARIHPHKNMHPNVRRFASSSEWVCTSIQDKQRKTRAVIGSSPGVLPRNTGAAND